MKFKKYPFIIFSLFLILILCACNDSKKYKDDITNSVNSNISYLNDFIKWENLSITDEITDMGVQKIQIEENFIIFRVASTGLSDGGVEYGFYYAINSDKELDKTISSNDYMVIDKIIDNWYYYEWHNG